MASVSTTSANMDGQAISRKPSKLVARSNTLHRPPHHHSGSGAGLWLANSASASPDASFAAQAPTSHLENTSQIIDSQQISSPQHGKKVYHFSAELARASFGGGPLALSGGLTDHDPIYINTSDDGDVDLDLSFDYVSRFDRSTSPSDQPDSSGSAFDSSQERDVQPPRNSHDSPDETSDPLTDTAEVWPKTPVKLGLANSSSPSDLLSSMTEPDASPSPNSKEIRSMRANADWEKRRKPPPAPLDLTPRSESKQKHQQAKQNLRIRAVTESRATQEPTLLSTSTLTPGSSIDLPPTSQELVGKSIFSPITPATGSVPFFSDFDSSSHASDQPLPLTPLSATRRGAAVNHVSHHPLDDLTVSTVSPGANPLPAAIRRVASTSAAHAVPMLEPSSQALRRTPTDSAHSPHYASSATPVQTRRARSHSIRSFRASASLASLGPPPFPPPNEPLPSPTISPSFKQEHSVSSTSAFRTANDDHSTLTKAGRTRPSASSIDYSEAARSLRSRTTQTGRSSLDSFRTAMSDGMAIAHSNHSIHTNRQWASEDRLPPPPLPPLQRYEALFPSHTHWDPAPTSSLTSNGSLGASGVITSSTQTSVPMAISSTLGSTASTAMTYSMSNRSTPSTHYTPLTPFTPAFSDVMPGTATSSKTQFTAITRPSISSELPSASDAHFKMPPTGMSSLGGAAATLKESSTQEEEGRGNRNTEQWILTQRQRKALLQHEELASHQRLLETVQGAARLSIRADERASQVVPSVGLSAKYRDAETEGRSRQDSRSTETTDDDHAKVRQTMVISTVSTPDESVDAFQFMMARPSQVPTSERSNGAAMERAASQNASQSSSTKASVPLTRNRSGTTGPWAQSPLLLDLNRADQTKTQTQDSIVSPASTTFIASNYATPQIDASPDDQVSRDMQHQDAVQGLGLDLNYPSTSVASDALPGDSTHDAVKGFAPVTTDLLRQLSRYGASPHLSIRMSPDVDALLQHTHSRSKEVLLTRESRQNLAHGLGLELAGGPSPLLPNDCRSPRTASGKEIGSGASGGLTTLINGPVQAQTDVTVHRAQIATDRTHVSSQSIASSISAFVYNATPAPLPNNSNAERLLDLTGKSKTGSIGWRRGARRSRENNAAQTLGLGMRHDSTDVKFVNVDLDDGGLETEVMLESDEANKSTEGAKAGQWVSKLWSSVTSPRRTSFNVGAILGDRSVDLELANNSTGERSGGNSEQQARASVSKSERTASRGSFRPLSLVEKRQSSGRSQLDTSRQRLRSPTPGEEDEVAEKDTRAVALRLLNGSHQIPAPVEEGLIAERTPEESMDRADLSAEEREKERIDALKRLRRMSAAERQKKRNSGIGYITSNTNAVESPRLVYVTDKANEACESHNAVLSTRHGGLSRAPSVNNKRMSLTMFGGKERATATNEIPLSSSSAATGAPERAWLDALRSPRMQESPSGFTPRMAFEPQDWGARSSSQQHQHLHGASQAMAGPSSTNHIPLLLSNNAIPHRQTPASAANSIQEHGLTVSALDRASDEMRRLAAQGMAFRGDELAQDVGESFHTPMPDAPDTCWSYASGRLDHVHYAQNESMAARPTTELGDFGISPEKKEAKLHRRTRSARFADDGHQHRYDHEDEAQPTVSIFTRDQQHRHRASGSFSVQYSLQDQPPSMEHGSRTKRRTSQYAAAGGHSFFATPTSLLDSNTPSKNMFWAGFLGMPWLWMIGGWYLTPDGQLRHPSTDDARVRSKVDVWQHEPSMQASANPSPNMGASSTAFGGLSHDPAWRGVGAGESGSGLGLAGMPSTMSYAASSVGTSNSAQTTNGDPNQPPPSKTRKSKTRSLGTLLDTNPQVSFYQSPVRTVQEPHPTFGNVWHHNRDMKPLPEVEEPRRSRIFAGYPANEHEHDHAFSPSPSPQMSSSDGTTTDVSAAEPKLVAAEPRTNIGSQVAVATKTNVGMAWKDLERYVLLNRVAAILSGVLVFAGFTGAVYAVVINF